MSLNTFLFQESCFIFLKYFEHSVLCPCNMYLHVVPTASKIANTVVNHYASSYCVHFPYHYTES